MYKKRGQWNSLLSIYGWPFLVIVLIFLTFNYMDVLSGTGIFPSKCNFEQKILCLDYKVSGDENAVYLRLQNKMDSRIYINSIAIKDKSGIADCFENRFENPLFERNQERTFVLRKCGNVLDKIKDSKGKRVNAIIELSFKNMDTKFTHTLKGELSVTVE